MPRFTHRKVIPIGATARVVVAQRAPETLTLVRHRTQSTAETIARLSVTAVFAYLVALPLPGAQHGLPLSPPSLRRRAAARIERMGSARVADPAGAARVLTGPPCPAGTAGSPGRGGAPEVSPGRSWQRGQKPGRDEA
jgi:hypothetical protein